VQQVVLDGHQKLQLAMEASVHPRTIDRAFRGKAVRPAIAHRIRGACSRLGFNCPVLTIARSGLWSGG